MMTTGRQVEQLFVGCFDVLGFKGLVETVPLPELLSMYEQLVHAVSGKPGSHNVVVVLGASPTGQLVGGRHVVPSAIFSDTMLLWSAEASAGEFLTACSSLVGESVRLRMPLRGGIAFGNMVVDQPSNFYLGKALVDAHVTEASQEWVGAGLHSSCFTSARFGGNLSGSVEIQPYAVPVKHECAAITHALVWQHYLHGTEGEDKLKALMAVAPAEARQKYQNAIDFVRRFP